MKILLTYQNVHEFLLRPDVRPLLPERDHLLTQLANAVAAGHTGARRHFGKQLLASLTAEQLSKVNQYLGKQLIVKIPKTKFVFSGQTTANELSNYLIHFDDVSALLVFREGDNIYLSGIR